MQIDQPNAKMLPDSHQFGAGDNLATLPRRNWRKVIDLQLNRRMLALALEVIPQRDPDSCVRHGGGHAAMQDTRKVQQFRPQRTFNRDPILMRAHSAHPEESIEGHAVNDAIEFGNSCFRQVFPLSNRNMILLEGIHQRYAVISLDSPAN
jgi:hypothetical protein